MIKNILIVTFLLLTNALADFTRDNNLNVVNDSKTYLMWQDDSISSNTWEGALNYCEALTLADYDDWRLPNFNELYSISDTNRYDPAIEIEFIQIPSVQNARYWSSTTNISNISNAWAINLQDSNDDIRNKISLSYVRCVRDNH